MRNKVSFSNSLNGARGGPIFGPKNWTNYLYELIIMYLKSIENILLVQNLRPNLDQKCTFQQLKVDQNCNLARDHKSPRKIRLSLSKIYDPMPNNSFGPLSNCLNSHFWSKFAVKFRTKSPTNTFDWTSLQSKAI